MTFRFLLARALSDRMTQGLLVHSFLCPPADAVVDLTYEQKPASVDRCGPDAHIGYNNATRYPQRPIAMGHVRTAPARLFFLLVEKLVLD